jgi:FtsP/CotA-like multicopper oxidase with cupredoxin domain
MAHDLEARYGGRLSRRGVIGLGAAGAAGVAAATLGGVSLGRRAFAGGESENFPEPPVRSSRGGFLETSFDQRESVIRFNNAPARAVVYESSYPGPMLRVRGGDRLRIRLTNGIPALTNFHYHGFHVSPSGNSDNVLVHVMPGEVYQMQVDIPASHDPGLYWYHPHFHTDTEVQVYGGLAGPIVVEGWIDQVPGIAGKIDRVLVAQTTTPGPDGRIQAAFNQTRADPARVRTCNGVVNPTFSIRPGETQRLRVLNANADDFMMLKLDGQPMTVIGIDGVPIPAPTPEDQFELAPGGRVELLVRGGRPGRYALKSLRYTEQFTPIPEWTVATMVVEGEPVEPTPFPTFLRAIPDLRQDRIAQRRELVFETKFPEFLINGRIFNENRVDQVVKLGTTEEWKLINKDDEVHPFHIHVNDFQVVAINDEPVRFPPVWWDVFKIPANDGSITIRQRFETFTGKTVYHCHVLMHEDSGMMGVFEIVP